MRPVPPSSGLSGVRQTLQGGSRKSGRTLTPLWPSPAAPSPASSLKYVPLCPGAYSRCIHFLFSRQIRHYLGPDVIIQNLGFTCSECFLALVYDVRELNLFKVVGSDDIIEFLDVEKPEDSAELTQIVSAPPAQ